MRDTFIFVGGCRNGEYIEVDANVVELPAERDNFAPIYLIRGLRHPPLITSRYSRRTIRTPEADIDFYAEVSLTDWQAITRVFAFFGRNHK